MSGEFWLLLNSLLAAGLTAAAGWYGLAAYAEADLGQLLMESEVGRGSRFWIELPRAEESAP